MRNKPSSHLLKDNKTTRTPQYFCFVDTESYVHKVADDRMEHEFRLGVAIFNRYRKDNRKVTRFVLRFVRVGEFWKHVNEALTGKNTMHIIAHNVGYDMVILQHTRYLTELGFECQFSFQEGLTFIAKWKNGDRYILILN